MAFIYSFTINGRFDSEAERDTWYNAVKNQINNAKGSLPTYRSDSTLIKTDAYSPDATQEPM